jgi:hypothetical protein
MAQEESGAIAARGIAVQVKRKPFMARRGGGDPRFMRLGDDLGFVKSGQHGFPDHPVRALHVQTCAGLLRTIGSANDPALRKKLRRD